MLFEIFLFCFFKTIAQLFFDASDKPRPWHLYNTVTSARKVKDVRVVGVGEEVCDWDQNIVLRRRVCGGTFVIIVFIIIIIVIIIITIIIVIIVIIGDTLSSR